MSITRTIATVLLLSGTTAYGSYWVSEFEGSAEQYKVVRGNETIAIAQLMLLQANDNITIDSPGGRLLVVDDRNERHELTVENTPFVVPESESPPQLLINVRNWVASWWNTRGNQSTSTMAAVSKGGLEPEVLVATSGDNFLLSGIREIHLAWRGGIGPFDLSIVSESGELLGRRTGISSFDAFLPEVALQDGQYNMKVAAGGAETNITLTAVGREQLPDLAEAILNLDLPDEIRFGHLAMLLSAYSHWRFEALQLAQNYNLTQLELDLLSGNFPESDISETNSMPGLSDSDRQTLPRDD